MDFLQGLNELNNMIGDPGHIGGALRDTIVFIAVITFLINLVQCFFGYKLIKWWISICGFALFGLIGFCIGYSSNGDSSSAIVWALILGIIGAIISFTLYKIGIFLIAFASGFLLGWLIVGSVGFGVILGTCIGVLSLFLLKPVLIISTAVSAGILAGKSLAIILEADKGVGIMFSIVLAIAGIVFQWITNSKTPILETVQANTKAANVNNGDNTTPMANINTEAMAETVEKAKDTINENVQKAKTTINEGVNTVEILLDDETEKAIAAAKGLNKFEILQEIRSVFYKNKILKPLIFYSDYIAIILCVLAFLAFTPIIAKSVLGFEVIITMLFINILLIIKERYKLYISVNSLNIFAVILSMFNTGTYSLLSYFLVLTVFVDYVGIYMFLQTKEGQKSKEIFINKCANNSINLTTKVRTPNIVVSCPKCNTLFSEEDTFCNNCGEKLIKVEITHKCSNCNAAYNEGDRFCNSCGSELITSSNIIEQEE